MFIFCLINFFWHISAQNIYLNDVHLERKHITCNQKEINISRRCPPQKNPLPSTLFIWLLPFNIRCVRLVNFLDVQIVCFHCWEDIYYTSISWWICSFFSLWRFGLFPILSIFKMLFWTFLSLGAQNLHFCWLCTQQGGFWVIQLLYSTLTVLSGFCKRVKYLHFQ